MFVCLFQLVGGECLYLVRGREKRRCVFSAGIYCTAPCSLTRVSLHSPVTTVDSPRTDQEVTGLWSVLSVTGQQSHTVTDTFHRILRGSGSNLDLFSFFLDKEGVREVIGETLQTLNWLNCVDCRPCPSVPT